MTKNRKRILVLSTTVGVALLLVIGFMRVAYWQSRPYSVASMSEIPCASRALRDMDTFGPLACVHLSRWRRDLFYVRGFTTQEVLLSLKAQHPDWTLTNKGEYARPPAAIALVMKAFGGQDAVSWTDENWVLEGLDEERCLVLIAFQPKSGLFYAEVGKERLKPGRGHTTHKQRGSTNKGAQIRGGADKVRGDKVRGQKPF